ncbi:hypothetical protein BC830DRAFT_363683 [Chytriomyces sp. MP71]|nr:hypothetical protein BC830DRAFT_363683 [Chytriomyces sp. MP71]
MKMDKSSVHPDIGHYSDDSEEYEVVSLFSGSGMASDGGDAAKTFDFAFVTRSLSIDFDKLSVSSASSSDESEDERRVSNRDEDDCESIQSAKTEEHVAESVGVGRDSESEVAQSVLNSWPPSISPVLNATPHSTTTTTIIPGTEQLFSSLFTSAENKETEGESLLRSFATALVATIFVALHALVSLFNFICAATLHVFRMFVPTNSQSPGHPAQNRDFKPRLNSIASVCTTTHSIYFGMSLFTVIIAVLYARIGSWSTPFPPTDPVLMASQPILSTTAFKTSTTTTAVIAQHKVFFIRACEIP